MNDFYIESPRQHKRQTLQFVFGCLFFTMLCSPTWGFTFRTDSGSGALLGIDNLLIDAGASGSGIYNVTFGDVAFDQLIDSGGNPVSGLLPDSTWLNSGLTAIMDAVDTLGNTGVDADPELINGCEDLAKCDVFSPAPPTGVAPFDPNSFSLVLGYYSNQADSLTDWVWTNSTFLNSTGWQDYMDRSSATGVTFSAVPLPAGLWLLASGLVAVWVSKVGKTHHR